MHFAYPTRKNSDPIDFRPRPSRLPLIQRGRVKGLAAVGAVVFLLVFLVRSLSGTAALELDREPAGTPPVVVVTMLEPSAFSRDYIESVRENRLKYAARHGYAAFFAQPGDYNLDGAPQSWSRVAAMRRALTTYPECRHVWFLDQDSYIMDPLLSLEDDVMDPSKLEGLMIKDYPVVPPDSITKTFSHVRAADVHLVVSQDKQVLSLGSIVIRNSDWARFFLDTWMDPLYRSYNFLKAESHALEHMAQWHPTILAKLALIPQRTISSYGNNAPGEQYQEGDFVDRFPDCTGPIPGQGRCEAEAAPFIPRWHAAFGLS